MNFRELPQNIIGKLLTVNSKNTVYYIMNDKSVKRIYFKDNFFNSAVSLGKYVIVDSIHLKLNEKELRDTINHEYGHTLQSKKLGWLYLIIVGIPSLFRNMYDRFFHKKWNYDKRCKWYYNGFPENWADKLGGVER